ncbi:MAG: hypothetical protein AAFZ11_08440, partial [Pseudomonadota bacterium]
ERLCAVQVKTRASHGADGGWHMGVKHEKLDSPSLFYCFVDFTGPNEHNSAVFILAAPVVAHVLTVSHQTWLSQPGRGGKARNDTTMRRLLPSYEHLGMADYQRGWLEPYRENWNQLSSD